MAEMKTFFTIIKAFICVMFFDIYTFERHVAHGVIPSFKHRVDSRNISIPRLKHRVIAGYRLNLEDIEHQFLVAVAFRTEKCNIKSVSSVHPS